MSARPSSPLQERAQTAESLRPLRLDAVPGRLRVADLSLGERRLADLGRGPCRLTHLCVRRRNPADLSLRLRRLHARGCLLREREGSEHRCDRSDRRRLPRRDVRLDIGGRSLEHVVGSAGHGQERFDRGLGKAPADELRNRILLDLLPKLVVGIDPIDQLADAVAILLRGRRKIGETLVAERREGIAARGRWRRTCLRTVARKRRRPAACSCVGSSR